MMPMEDCVFCKIVRGEIPAEFIYNDEKIVGFPSNKPQAPIHMVFVPKEHLATFLEVSDEVFGSILKAIQKKVIELGLKEKSYRVIVNGGKAQEVPHVHFHLLGEVVS